VFIWIVASVEGGVFRGSGSEKPPAAKQVSILQSIDFELIAADVSS